jgi:hypothetical protein
MTPIAAASTKPTSVMPTTRSVSLAAMALLNIPDIATTLVVS